MDKRKFKGKNLRKCRISIIGNVYSITICTQNKQYIFHSFKAARILINAMRFQDERDYTETIAFVVMPDHLHWLFELKESELSKIVHSIKSFCSHKIELLNWQEGYYEHQLRNEESIMKHSRYIVANPLRARLVSDIGLYPHWDAVWLTGEIRAETDAPTDYLRDNT